MTITSETVVRRAPFHGGAEAFSGATLERVELSDGGCFILKHLPPEGDWLTRASGGRDRLLQLWATGVLDRVGAVVDHAIVDIIEEDGHDVVVMRDVSDHLLAAAVRVGRSTSRDLLAGLAALHDLGRDLESQPLCSIDARYQMFAPRLHAPGRQPGAHPSRELIRIGWTRFAEIAPADVVEVVFAVHAGALRLSSGLADRPTTLVHGDAKLANLGLGPNGLIAIDWGDLTGFGPAEVDVAWYALMNETRLGVSADQTFADYDSVATHPLDPAAVDVACVGSLAQMGFKLTGAAINGRTPETRQRAKACLDWWCHRVRVALDRTGAG